VNSTATLDAAERAVIGAMLVSSQATVDVSAKLAESDFRDPILGALFAGLVELHSEQSNLTEPDWLLLLDRVDAGKPLTLRDLQPLADAVPTAANVGYYARQVADGSVLRRYWAAGHDVVKAVEAGADVETVAQKALNGLQSAQNARVGAGMQAKDYEALMTAQDAPHNWVVPNYLEVGDRFVLTGHEGLGKSMLLRQAAVMTAIGLSFVTGETIPPKRVLVVDVENSERMWRRTTHRMWQTARDRGLSTEDRLWVACHGRIDLTRGDHLASLHRLVDQHQPDLVVIGPLYKLTSKAITSDDDAAPVITALDSLRDRGVTLMLETHMGHGQGSNGDRNVRPRGSAALLGWPEFGYGIAPAKNDPGEGGPGGLVDMIAWRGQRDRRDWPEQWVRGATWPWERWS